MIQLDQFRAGYIAIIGKPNVGKSTFMNRLLDFKLSMISPRPQTTRRRVMGVGLLVLGLGAVVAWGALHGFAPSTMEVAHDQFAVQSVVRAEASPARELESEPVSVVDEETAADSKEAFLKGRQLMAMGRHAEAIAQFEEASRLDPAVADTHYRLGLAYVRTGDMESARAERIALEALEPRLANLLGNLVR